jgi:hypothetical protein
LADEAALGFVHSLKNIYFKRINRDQNFNELHLHLVRFLTFLCGLLFRAGTMKTAINSLKTVKKKIDKSFKYFCGGFGFSDSGYPKRFFSAGTTE